VVKIQTSLRDRIEAQFELLIARVSALRNAKTAGRAAGPQEGYVPTTQSYVVQLVQTGRADVFEHFGILAAAMSFGADRVDGREAELANLFAVVDAANAHDAIEMVRARRASLVATRGPRPRAPGSRADMTDAALGYSGTS
jgi:hypothetical protein